MQVVCFCLSTHLKSPFLTLLTRFPTSQASSHPCAELSAAPSPKSSLRSLCWPPSPPLPALPGCHSSQNATRDAPNRLMPITLSPPCQDCQLQLQDQPRGTHRSHPTAPKTVPHSCWVPCATISQSSSDSTILSMSHPLRYREDKMKQPPKSFYWNKSYSTDWAEKNRNEGRMVL